MDRTLLQEIVLHRTNSKEWQDLKDHDPTIANLSLQESDASPRQMNEDKKVNHHLQREIILAMDGTLLQEIVPQRTNSKEWLESLKSESVMIHLKTKIRPKNGIHLLSLRGRHD